MTTIAVVVPTRRMTARQSLNHPRPLLVFCCCRPCRQRATQERLVPATVALQVIVDMWVVDAAVAAVAEVVLPAVLVM